MTPALLNPLGFWRTVGLLLRTARKRAAGRQKRQAQLLHNRLGKNAIDWGALGFALFVAWMAIVHIFSAVAVQEAVKAGQRLEAAQSGRMVVSLGFANRVVQLEARYGDTAFPTLQVSQALEPYYRAEAREIANGNGGNPARIEQRLRDLIKVGGSQAIVDESMAVQGLSKLADGSRLPAALGSIVLLLWSLMLVLQGEGVELDVQRRRHPMWEWLLAHPVRPGAVFLAEALLPLGANPIFFSAPLFPGILYGLAYGLASGILAALLIGIPITFAAACLGKVLEIAIILRLPPRARAAVLGLMGWVSYTAMTLLIASSFVTRELIVAIGSRLAWLTLVPWPWLGFFLRGASDGSLSFQWGLARCAIAAGLILGVAVGLTIWAARRSLDVNSASSPPPVTSARRLPVRFGSDPLYRKELLWLRRDPGAIVQIVLMPVTLAAVQLLNFRNLVHEIPSSWNYLCGAAILFGTYFLWVLGPRSLASEGAALWIAMSWPRGLENLLKAKARLWSLIASAIVGAVLCFAAFRFPEHLWQVALTAVGWCFFARSMAAKAVTLVTVPSSSGEVEKIPAGRRFATQLGMFTFSVGVLSQQWTLAATGIVYSAMSAAAMWQNFRARLPYLYDRWSESLPPPPTLMHAMIAISVLVDSAAVLTGIPLAFGGDAVIVLQPLIYALCAVVVCGGMLEFLKNRGVKLADVLNWQDGADRRSRSASAFSPGRSAAMRQFALTLALGMIGGALLGLLALGYVGLLELWPSAAELLHRSQQQMAKLPELKVSYAIIAVLAAPFAEEFMFRGLLFRALDREWGGWRAVLGSAAFFAIYHPPLSWLPVGALGAVNAILFKRSGRLAPAVALHMVYNAVVVAS